MKRQYLRGYVQRAEGEDGEKDGPLRIIAATEGVKGDGLNLTMDTADLKRFKANPIVGYGHSFWGRENLPIGRSLKTWTEDKQLMMDIEFDQDDDFARTVDRKYRSGIMNTFSIGFDAWNIGDDGKPEGWELFEVSAVPLPMDPDAVVEDGRDETLALVRALAGVTDARAGKVLSKGNKKLVKDAVTALQALLSAAGDEDDEGDDRGAPKGASRLIAERRLQLAELGN